MLHQWDSFKADISRISPLSEKNKLVEWKVLIDTMGIESADLK